jgi:L-arabinonolactonase
MRDPLVTQQALRSLRWDTPGQRWWWAAAGKAAAYASSPGLQAMLTCQLPDEAGMLAHCASGRLLLALAKRICVAEVPPGVGTVPLRLQALAAVDPAEPRTSVCDGRTDRRGFLVFGTANEGADQRPIGSFFQYSVVHGLRRLALPTVTRACSICFDLAGSTMYFADAAGNGIFQCDYEPETARVANVRPFAVLGAGTRPRGGMVDAEGHVWSAQDRRLVRYAPDGGQVLVLDVECEAPAFGGAGLTQLVAASAAGLLVLPPAGVAGIADTPFDDVVSPNTIKKETI